MSEIAVSAHTMGNFVGGDDCPKHLHLYQACPDCGALMSPHAQRCVACRGEKDSERRLGNSGLQESKMDNHHRFNAALRAGWTEAMLLTALPYTLPTWEEIASRSPEAVMQHHPEIVIREWWGNREE